MGRKGVFAIIISLSLILLAVFALFIFDSPDEIIYQSQITKYAQIGKNKELKKYLEENIFKYDVLPPEKKEMFLLALTEIEKRKISELRNYIHEQYFHSDINLQVEIVRIMNIYRDTFPSFERYMTHMIEFVDTYPLKVPSTRVINSYDSQRCISYLLTEAIKSHKLENNQNVLQIFKCATNFIPSSDSFFYRTHYSNVKNFTLQINQLMETQDKVSELKRTLYFAEDSRYQKRTFTIKRRFEDNDTQQSLYEAIDHSSYRRVVLIAEPSDIPDGYYERNSLALVVEALGEKKYSLQDQYGYGNASEYAPTYLVVARWDVVYSDLTQLQSKKQQIQTYRVTISDTYERIITEISVYLNFGNTDNNSLSLINKIKNDTFTLSDGTILPFINGKWGPEGGKVSETAEILQVVPTKYTSQKNEFTLVIRNPYDGTAYTYVHEVIVVSFLDFRAKTTLAQFNGGHKVELKPDVIITTHGDYIEGDGICCPSYKIISTLKWNGQVFSVVDENRVKYN